MTTQPQFRAFEPDNIELDWHLKMIRQCLGAPSYQRCAQGFREQTGIIFRWTWGAPGFCRGLEPGAWVSKKVCGIIRKGKDRQAGLVVVDHKRPLVLLFADMQHLKEASTSEIYEFLVRENILVHIHSEEDAELNRSGWRDRKRPHDGYEQAGIEVLYVPIYNRNGPIPHL